MAKEFLVGVVINGSLGGGFKSAFDGAKGTIKSLGGAVDQLTAKQKQLADAMRAGLGRAAPEALVRLKTHYDRLGQAIDDVRRKQMALVANLARGQQLKDQRADLRSQMLGTVATGAAIAAPLGVSVAKAASYQDKLRDIAITGEFNAAQEAAVGATIRQSSVRWNQFQDDVANGVNVLVAGGIQQADELQRYAPILAKTATATRAGMDDLGNVLLALRNNLKITAADSEQSLNILTYTGKRGQFEIRDMAKWLPTLAPSFQALGVTGPKAVAEIGAALQIARKGAGSNDEAANNFRNFLQKMTAPDTLKDFDKAGIDLKKSMQTLVSKGMTPVGAMLDIITQYMHTKGPKAAAEFQKAIAIEDAQAREAALQRLAEAYQLGTLFQDMQAMAFIRPALANRAEMKDIQSGAMQAGQQDVIGADFDKRMGSAVEQFKAFRIQATEIGIIVGNALLPALTDLLARVMPIARAFGDWAQRNPAVIRGIVGLVGAAIGLRMGLLGLRFVFNAALLTPLNLIGRLVLTVVGKFALLRVALAAGRFAGVANAIRLVGTALLWVGRIALANPIGLAVTAIAVSALLIYKYWNKIGPFFQNLWARIKGYFESFVSYVTGLPGRMFAAGANMMSQFAAGVKAKAVAAIDAAKSTAKAIAGYLIGNSPPPLGPLRRIDDPRLMETLAGGLRPSGAVLSRARDAAAQLHGALTASGGAAGAVSVQFSPTINVAGAAGASGDIKAQVQEGLRISLHQFEQLLKRTLEQQQRRAYV